MRHLKSGRQLSRNSSHRWALMRNLITSLLREEKIQTTDPKVMDKWRDNNIPDDRPTGENLQSNQPGMVTFAKAGFPDSRSTQIFVNYVHNASLDQQGFTPFGKVLSGMEALEALNAKYGRKASDQQGRIQKEGNAFLDKAYPGLDSLKRASIVETSAATDEAKTTDDTKSNDDKPKDGEKP